MADVAGTVIGVISLSIQLFDKLSKYTNGVKDANTKAEQILIEMDDLADLLEQLETVTNKITMNNSTALAKRGICQCARAIDMVKAKLGDNNLPTSRPWAKFRKTVRRLAYPFEEADIKYWKDVLAYVQQHLNTALLALLIDQHGLQFDGLHAQIGEGFSSIYGEIRKVAHQQRSLSEHLSQRLTHSPCFDQVASLSEPRGPETLQNSLQVQQQASSTFAPKHRSLSPFELDERTTQSRIDMSTMARVPSNMAREEISPIGCTCREQRQGELILRRPVFLTYVKLHAHARGCPFWSKQSLQTNLTFGLILCCLTLGLKWRLLLAVSVGTRSLSAVPSLTIHRVVGPSSSPAFMSVASAVASPINKDTVPALFRDLQNIFGTRRASPHDRLPNGQTLLHYLCSGLGQRVWILDKRQLHHYRSLLKVILSFVGCRNASEIDDMGNTCVDLLLRATDPVDQTWNTLVSDLLETGLQISTNCHPNGSFESYGSWVEIPFAGFPNPFFSSTEATDIFLIRSEPQLRHYLQELQHRNCIAPGGSQRLYKMATRMGWVYGCEAMLDSGLGYIPELVEGARARNPISEPLLFDAIESRSTQMVSFWLHIRDKVDPEHLPYIGDLEAAFVHASEIFQLQDIAELLLSHLIERRKQFFQLAVASNILDVGNFTDAGILDAHATCVARALAEQCIEVPPAVWPSRNSVYNIKQLYQEQPPVYDATVNSLRTFQRLYDSGFKLIAANDCSRHYVTTCSPLMYAITSYRRFDPSPGSLPRFFEIIEWFLDRGASLLDCWPNSKSTALHCMASKAAMLTWARPVDRFSLQSLAAVLRRAVTDDCNCCCTMSGCAPLTSFWKSLYRFDVGYMATISELSRKKDGLEIKPSKYRRIGRWELEHAIRCIDRAVTSAEHRWIVSHFIRLMVFSLLGIRHVCCNLHRIEYIGEPHFERNPLPRYPPDKVERIRREDEHLVAIMELNVSILDTCFDAHDGDLQAFVDRCLLPRMQVILTEL